MSFTTIYSWILWPDHILIHATTLHFHRPMTYPRRNEYIRPNACHGSLR